MTADFGTADGTATTANNDYAATNGMLVLAPGVTSSAVTVWHVVRLLDPSRLKLNDLVSQVRNGQERGANSVSIQSAQKRVA